MTPKSGGGGDYVAAKPESATTDMEVDGGQRAGGKPTEPPVTVSLSSSSDDERMSGQATDSDMERSQTR